MHVLLSLHCNASLFNVHKAQFHTTSSHPALNSSPPLVTCKKCKGALLPSACVSLHYRLQTTFMSVHKGCKFTEKHILFAKKKSCNDLCTAAKKWKLCCSVATAERVALYSIEIWFHELYLKVCTLFLGHSHDTPLCASHMLAKSKSLSFSQFKLFHLMFSSLLREP